MTRTRTFVIALTFMLFVQGCFPAQPQTTTDTESPSAEVVDAQPTEALATETPQPTPTPAPTTEPTPTPEPRPSVSVTAVGGNLYIRRGPGTAFDRIGLLSKGESANVIGQDVLSKWVQVTIPGGEQTGWVSLLTPFSQLNGDLSSVQSFTFTDWPKPAFIENCTEHELLVLPNELYLYNVFTNSSFLNEVQVDPGVYQIKDLFVAGEPVYLTVDVSEGEVVYITENALGEKHLCGAQN